MSTNILDPNIDSALAEPAEQIGRDIATAFIHLEALDRQTLAAGDPPLTTAQYHALVALSAAPAPSLSELARRLLCDKANASKLVDRLIALGLGTRTQDREDARKVILGLTPEGQAALAQATRLRVAALSNVFAPIHGEGLQDVQRHLATLVALLRLATNGSTASARRSRNGAAGGHAG
jgi:DNA-binding MarR family transcriptional regulator